MRDYRKRPDARPWSLELAEGDRLTATGRLGPDGLAPLVLVTGGPAAPEVATVEV